MSRKLRNILVILCIFTSVGLILSSNRVLATQAGDGVGVACLYSYYNESNAQELVDTPATHVPFNIKVENCIISGSSSLTVPAGFRVDGIEVYVFGSEVAGTVYPVEELSPVTRAGITHRVWRTRAPVPGIRLPSGRETIQVKAIVRVEGSGLNYVANPPSTFLLSRNTNAPSLENIDTGCCNAGSNTSDDGSNPQCSDWLGSSAKCTNINGACSTGVQCSGGSSMGLGGACDPSGVNNRCGYVEDSNVRLECAESAGGYTCQRSCNTLLTSQEKYDCIVNKYLGGSTEAAEELIIRYSPCSSDGERNNCNCTSGTVISTSEASFNEVMTSCPLESNNQSSIECSLLVSGRDATLNSVRICFSSTINQCPQNGVRRCTSVTGVVNGRNINVTVNPGCLLPGSYDLVVDSGPNTEIFGTGTVNFQGGASIITTNITSDSNIPRTVRYRVLDRATNITFCEYTDSAAEVVDPSLNPDRTPPTSDQFGERNCPNVVWYDINGETTTDARLAVRAAVNTTGTTQEQRNEASQCLLCIRQKGTWTALGCIVTTPDGIFTAIIRIALGVMGGIALLRLIFLGYQYNFGSDEKLKPAVQDILATLGGLLLVIFSVLLLRVIGVNLLDVVPPGFFGTN